VIDQLRSLVDSAGPLGPAAFVAAYAILTVALVPGTIPSLAAGALFGPVWGSLRSRHWDRDRNRARQRRVRGPWRFDR